MMIVKGKPYRTDLTATLQLRTMRRVKAEFGYGWGTITAYLAEAPDGTPLADMMSDDRFLAWMWAWIVNAGGDMTRDELESLTIDEVDFAPDRASSDDEGDGGEPETPTSAPTDSGRGDEPPARAAKATSRTRASTRTSKKPS